MIRVQKSAKAPLVLINKGVPATAINCRLYNADPDGYKSGRITFVIDFGIYNHPSVKQQLIDEQHGKCCFCEADFTANGYGDVEHFRPKAGFTATRTGKLIRPGYYWLAYDWENLFFSCQICNQRFKKNHFPLDDEASRVIDHSADYRREANLLIHPSINEPGDHITFNRHIPVGKDKRGKQSIIAFGLNRDDLNRIREAHLQNVQINRLLAGCELIRMTEDDRLALVRRFGQSWETIETLILTAKAFMATAKQDRQPFAAMVRAYLS